MMSEICQIKPNFELVGAAIDHLIDADRCLRIGSSGRNRCDGVGIIIELPEMREGCRPAESGREWLPLKLGTPNNPGVIRPEMIQFG